MKVTGKVLLLILAGSAVALAAAGESAPRAPCGEPKVLVYRGASDASVGVAVGEDMFVVAAGPMYRRSAHRKAKPSMARPRITAKICRFFITLTIGL